MRDLDTSSICGGKWSTPLVLPDKQIVNIYQENLLMALSNVMGFYAGWYQIAEPLALRKTVLLIYTKLALTV